MDKIFFSILTLIGGYLGYCVGGSVPEPSFLLTTFLVLFCALIMACVAASFLENCDHPDNRSLFRRIAPLALLYWLSNRKD